MKPNTIDENISSLLEAFKESPEYVEFQKQNEILKQKPELKKRVDAFRGDNYRVQNECGSDNLFDVVEKMQTSGSKCISGCRACSLQNDAEDLRKTGRRHRHGYPWCTVNYRKSSDRWYPAQ